MSILRFSRSRQMTLGLALVGGFTLAGCDGGGGSEAAIGNVTDGAHGKAQKAARESQFGPTGNSPAGKVAPKPKNTP